jgi:hypothetical protein
MRAVGWAFAAGVGLNVLAWWVLGFDQIPVYVQMLHTFGNAAQWWGYGLITLMLHLGAGGLGAYAVGLGLGCAAAIAGWRAGARGEDRLSFTWLLLATLLASPIVEVHYLSLLVLPLALAQPRFGVIWTLPLLLVLTPADHPPDPVRLLLLAVMAVVVADALGALRRDAVRERDAALATRV